MTPPPISIDGTDITGATIDGQEVTEITIDGQTVFTTAIPDSGIARYFKTNTLSDQWYDNDLTDNGGITFGSGGPAANYYAVFDGVDDYASSPLQFAPSDDFSVVGWVYFASISDGDIYHFTSQRQSFSSMDWQLYYDNNDQTTANRGIKVGIGESLASRLTTGVEINVDTWAHIGLTKGGDTWTVYLDGSQVFSQTDSTSWTPSETVDIGGRGGAAYHGRIQLLDFYSKELSATEVSNHYNTASISG